MRRTAGPRQILQDVHGALAHIVGAGGVCINPYSPPRALATSRRWRVCTCIATFTASLKAFSPSSRVRGVSRRGKGLWLAPWQVRHDGPATVPQSMPLQDSDRQTEGTARPTTQPLVAPTSEADSLPSAPMPQSPEQPHTSATSEEPTEVLDTQAMQRLVTRLDEARSNPAEHLDARAMDRLLARLESADKTGSPSSPRSKVVRKSNNPPKG